MKRMRRGSVMGSMRVNGWSARDCSIRNWVLAVAMVWMASWAQAAGPTPSSGPTFTVNPSWTLIAYGDTRFTDPAERTESNPVARQALVHRIAEEKPGVLLIGGDLPFHGGEVNDYVVYQMETEPWREAGIKVYPALGNHELSSRYRGMECKTCLQNWWGAFPELRGRRWYSVRFGEAYIVTLDSNLALGAGSAQSRWLARQLKELPHDVRYLFVSLHHPPVADPIHGDASHNVRPNEDALARQLEAAAKQISAKIIVIAGHIHAYQRFERGGVEYLVSGGGGARPYPIARTPSNLYQDNVFPNFHYVKFVSDGDKLRVTMYRLDNDKFVPGDSFTVSSATASHAGK